MLPHLLGVTKVNSEVRVKVTSNPLTLRSIIADRVKMQEFGPAIFRNLVKAFLDIQEAGISCRTIQPSSIRMKIGEWKPVFTDISSICGTGDKPLDDCRVSAPYTSERYTELAQYGNTEAFRDAYSVGVTLLEILVGTPLVVSNPEYEQVENLLDIVQDYLDPRLVEVLRHLIFEAGQPDIGAFAALALQENPSLVAQGVRGVQAAILDDAALGTLSYIAENFVLNKQEDLKRKYNIEIKK